MTSTFSSQRYGYPVPKTCKDSFDQIFKDLKDRYTKEEKQCHFKQTPKAQNSTDSTFYSEIAEACNHSDQRLKAPTTLQDSKIKSLNEKCDGLRETIYQNSRIFEEKLSGARLHLESQYIEANKKILNANCGIINIREEFDNKCAVIEAKTNIQRLKLEERVQNVEKVYEQDSKKVEAAIVDTDKRIDATFQSLSDIQVEVEANYQETNSRISAINLDIDEKFSTTNQNIEHLRLEFKDEVAKTNQRCTDLKSLLQKVLERLEKIESAPCLLKDKPTEYELVLSTNTSSHSLNAEPEQSPVAVIEQDSSMEEAEFLLDEENPQADIKNGSVLSEYSDDSSEIYKPADLHDSFIVM